jgi:hypothetical protein
MDDKQATTERPNAMKAIGQGENQGIGASPGDGASCAIKQLL